MMSDSSAANGNAAKSEDSIQQSLRATALIRRETFTMMRIMISYSIPIRSLNTEKKLGNKWNTR
ncbi:hypothetical protein DAPPUDRAFT_242208 [Daphnia pulex]|uniref:Uncharacterized protein n=1 Tax=Daphnia pulex TaxID=6669 RepID=E9GG37_DAPPU|nr:hypothetical protein DAPPUDRAFT_242208 [Daphnia pulex]|eukprot:EFX81561.1 hypothetical protein DAPPUDRAFT_242208 [Daphnia pulex]